MSVDAIVAGAADTATTSVFLLDLRFDNGAAGICSAVLVSPRVLLTAAHCVEPVLKSATSVTVKATNKANDSSLKLSDFTDVTQVSRHPQWNPADSMSHFDLAALLLAAAPSGVTVPELARALPSNFLGQQVRIVGYGRTSASGTDNSGTRRSAQVAVSAVVSDEFEFGDAGTTGICGGDSGGAAFWKGSDQQERVAGIHSLTRSAQCGSGTDIRVDARLPFIDGFIAANDPPSCSGDGRCASGCSTVDPDCPTDCGANGVCSKVACATPDPDCPNDCGANGVCSIAACPTPDPDCVDHCPMDGVCSTRSCAVADPDCLTDGDVCSDAAACPGHLCLIDKKGFSFCSRACAADGDCERAMTCQSNECRAPQPHAGCAAAGGPLLSALALWAWGRAVRSKRGA